MDQRALDGIRITDVRRDGGGVSIAVDAAAAYKPALGLTTFHRAFHYDGGAGFVVEDTIELREPKSVQWFLHSDKPFEGSGASFSVPGPGALLVTIAAPADARTTNDHTRLTAPGRPGSITDGPEEQRGYHLQVETVPASRVTIRVELKTKR